MADEVRFARPDALELFEAQDAAMAVHDQGGFGVGYIERDPTQDDLSLGRLVFVNPFARADQTPVWTPTFTPPEDVSEISSRIYPIPEAYMLMGRYAAAYALNLMQLVDGPSSVGKTFLLGRFSEMVHGKGVVPLRLVFHPQSDGSGVFASYAPRTEGDQDDEPANWLMRDGVVALGMGRYVDMSDAGMSIESFPEGTIVNLDEVDKAPQGVTNALLGLRGEGGSVAEEVALAEIGRVLIRGPRTRIVMTSNPPGNGAGSHALNPALVRGTDYFKMGELSPESLKIIARRTVQDAAKLFADSSYGVDLSKNPEMTSILAEVMTSVHMLFGEIIKAGARADAQQVVLSIDDMHRVSKYMQMQQIISRKTLKPDVARTLEVALNMFYADRIGDSIKKEALAKSIRTIVYENRPGETTEAAEARRADQQQTQTLEIGKMSRAERINQLASELYGEDEQSAVGGLRSFEVVLATLQKLAFRGLGLPDDFLMRFTDLRTRANQLMSSTIAGARELEELQKEALALVGRLNIGEFNVGALRPIDTMNSFQHTKVYALKGGYYIAAGSGDEVFLFPGYEQSNRIRLTSGVVKDIDVMGGEVYILESGNEQDTIKRYDAESAKPLEPVQGFETEIAEVHVDDTTGTMVVVDRANNAAVIRRDGTRTAQLLNTDSRRLEKTAISSSGDLIGYVVSQSLDSGKRRLSMRIARLESDDAAFREVVLGDCVDGAEIRALKSISPTNFAVGIDGDVVVCSFVNDTYEHKVITLPNSDVVRAIDVNEDGSQIVVAGRSSIYALDVRGNLKMTSQPLFTDGTEISDMTVYESPIGTEICVATSSGLHRFA